MRARAIIGLFVLLLVFAACSGDTTETTVAATAPPASSTTTTLAPVTTTVAPTTTSSTTTTTLAPEVPYPDLTIGDDPVQLWLNIIDFFNWMEQHPDPDLVTVIFHEDAPRTPALQELYANFNELGYRYTDTGIEVLSIVVLSQAEDRIVLETVNQRGDQTVADQNGDLVGIESGWQPQVSQATLTLGEDGRWRVADSATLRDATPEDLDRPAPR